MPNIRAALLYIEDATAAIERAGAAWNASQLRDAIGSAKDFIALAEKSLDYAEARRSIPVPPKPPATRYVQDNRPPPLKPPPPREVREGIEPRTPYSPPPRQRMPLIFFIAMVILILVGAVLSFPAHGAELEFDPKAAQQEKMFNLLAWQTINCMSSGAMNQVRMGERDADKLADWLVSTCASQLARYSIEEMKIEPKRVLRLMRAMATTEIANVPGVTLKKP
jgi:hypothetical protein